MTAVDPAVSRLAAALHGTRMLHEGSPYLDDVAAAVLAADSALADALRTGLLLARLVEALPDGWTASVRVVPPGVWVWDPSDPFSTARYSPETVKVEADTLPDALEAALAALEAPDAR